MKKYLLSNLILLCFSYPLLAISSPLKVAIVLNKTGENQINSEWMNRGIRLGAKEISDKGIHLSFEYFDDMGTELGAQKVAKQIQKRKDISLVIAGYSSKSAIPLAQNITHLPMINVFGSSLNIIANKENHISLVSDNHNQGKLLASYMRKQLKKKNPCLIIETDDGFSLEILSGFEEENGKGNKNIFKYDSKNLSQLLLAIKSCNKTNADLLVHSGRTSAIRFLLEKHLELSPQTPILGSDGWGDFENSVSDLAAKKMKETNAKVNFAFFWNEVASTPRQFDFIKTYSEFYQGQSADTLSALAHDAVILAAGFLKNTKGSLKNYVKNEAPLFPLVLLGERKIQIPLNHRIYRLGSDRKTNLEKY